MLLIFDIDCLDKREIRPQFTENIEAIIVAERAKRV